MQMPAIPDDLIKSLETSFKRVFEEQLDTFRHETAPAIAGKYVALFSEKLERITPGEDLLGFKVTHVSAKKVMLKYSVQELECAWVPTLKLRALEVEVELDKTITVSASGEWAFDIRIARGKVLIQSQTDSLDVQLGGTFVAPPNEENGYYVAVAWGSPSFRAEGLYQTSGAGGFLFDVSASTPFPIPLASTGFALWQIGLMYGENFVPKFPPDPSRPNATAMELIDRAETSQYGTWAKLHALDQWVAVPNRTRLFGLKVGIGDITSKGAIVNLREAGLSYFDYGPMIVFQGDLEIFGFNMATALGVLDVRKLSMYCQVNIGGGLMGMSDKVLDFIGSIDVNASFGNPANSYVAVGGLNMSGCEVKLLGLLDVTGGALLIPSRGLFAKASGRARGELKFLGAGAGYSFSMDMSGAIGWNPAELGASLLLSGDAWMDLWGTRVAVGVGGRSRAAVRSGGIEFESNAGEATECRHRAHG